MADKDIVAAAEEMDVFTGEIWLSTDGKHTVHIAADTAAGRKAGGKWAVEAYKWIVKELGTKPELWEEVMTKKNGKEPERKEEKATSTCPHTQFKVKQVSKEGPNKGKYFKVCVDCGKFLGWV